MTRAAALAEQIRGGDWVRRIGRIVRFVGLTVESTGPDARVGEICEIHARGRRGVTLAEVVGFSEQRVLLMPFGDLQGIEIGSEVIATGRSADVAVGDELLGRVIDGFGQPLDDAPLDIPALRYSLYPPPLNPLQRGMVRD
ncbi:MAG TPA: flagellum-specific ATP synthase FliI, partial [Planctomycetota bacterium]|nr:flagellum-specific ATP synthase FliI [Planctomycetota bacterium]